MEPPYDDDPNAPQQRGLPEEFLLNRIHALEASLEEKSAALARAEQENRRIEAAFAQAREVNQHLVLATVAAEQLRPHWLWAPESCSWRFELLCGHGCVPLDDAAHGCKPTFKFACGVLRNRNDFAAKV